MFKQCHQILRYLPYGSTEWVDMPVWYDAALSSSSMLFQYGGAWRIAEELMPTVRIGGVEAYVRGVVDGYLAWQAGRTGRTGSLTLFHTPEFGWVVAYDFEHPREFDYAVDDGEGNPLAVQAGTEFWTGTLPEINDVGGAAFRARGSLRDTSPQSEVAVVATWDYWQGGEGAGELPATGPYAPRGGKAGTPVVGFPAWLDADGETVRFMVAEGVLVEGNRPGGAAAKVGGRWVYRRDGSGAWSTASDPQPDRPWTFAYSYDAGWEGETPEKADVALQPTRAFRYDPDDAEYVYAAPRIP